MIALEESVGWGLACLFLPFASLIFTIRHWDEAKAPFLWSVFGVLPLVFLGIFVSIPQAERWRRSDNLVRMNTGDQGARINPPMRSKCERLSVLSGCP